MQGVANYTLWLASLHFIYLLVLLWFMSWFVPKLSFWNLNFLQKLLKNCKFPSKSYEKWRKMPHNTIGHVRQFISKSPCHLVTCALLILNNMASVHSFLYQKSSTSHRICIDVWVRAVVSRMLRSHWIQPLKQHIAFIYVTHFQRLTSNFFFFSRIYIIHEPLFCWLLNRSFWSLEFYFTKMGFIKRQN